MNLFTRHPSRNQEKSITRSVVPDCYGSMTSHHAWHIVHPVVKSLDPRARCTLITSGLDMNGEGLSRTWEFIFYLPGRDVVVMLSLEPDHECPNVDRAPCIMTQRRRPADTLDAERLPLPECFRDSPDVVSEFSARGVDFVAGPTDMKLESRMLREGEGVWVTYYWDQEYTTSFT